MRARSLRRQLLAGILIPLVLIVAFNTWSLYRQALAALNTAYDRTLLASAKSLGESLDVRGEGDAARLQANVPSAALEAFEADLQSRMAYRISTRQGVLLSGYDDLPMWHGQIPMQPPYAALVDFYDGQFRGEPVRMAVLLQPVASTTGRDVAVVQVAETLEIRHALARQILWDTLARQAALIALIAATVIVVVQRATRPVRALSHELQARPDDDLRPIAAPDAPRELQPLIAATNEHMRRQSDLLAQQQRFVRDASHQLRTPLAVLKALVQSARRGDVAEAVARAVSLQEAGGRTFELGGPAVYAFEDLMKLVLRETNRSKPLIGLPFGAAKMLATLMKPLGLLGVEPPITGDQVLMLQRDNVVASGAEGLAALGIEPTGLEAIAPSYLWRFRRGGQFAEAPIYAGGAGETA